MKRTAAALLLVHAAVLARAAPLPIAEEARGLLELTHENRV